jgi:hypothetical protein
MGVDVQKTRVLISLTFLISLACIFSTELRAQTCTLDLPMPITRVDGASGTNFLPAGREGQIVVRRKFADSLVVRLFETNSPKPQSWKELSQPPS